MQRYNAKHFIPFIILFALLNLLCRELYSADKSEINAQTIAPMPAFSLPYLNNPDKSFTQQDIKGHVSLINIWASWCSACKMEHELLMKIKETGIPIYGILYKDDASNALKYLNRHGNPYSVIGNDEFGDISNAFDIYGTPETYVINPDGDIIYRQIGAMDEEVWDTMIYPMIKKYLPKKTT